MPAAAELALLRERLAELRERAAAGDTRAAFAGIQEALTALRAAMAVDPPTAGSIRQASKALQRIEALVAARAEENRTWDELLRLALAIGKLERVEQTPHTEIERFQERQRAAVLARRRA